MLRGGPRIQVIVGYVALRAISRTLRATGRFKFRRGRVIRLDITHSGTVKHCRVVVNRGPVCVVALRGPKGWRVVRVSKVVGWRLEGCELAIGELRYPRVIRGV